MTLVLWIMVGFIIAKLLLLIPLFMSIRDSYRTCKELKTKRNNIERTQANP